MRDFDMLENIMNDMFFSELRVSPEHDEEYISGVFLVKPSYLSNDLIERLTQMMFDTF